jgi:hypothetical protein
LVQLKSGKCDPSEVKNIIDNLLKLAFFEVVATTFPIESLCAYIDGSWTIRGLYIRDMSMFFTEGTYKPGELTD